MRRRASRARRGDGYGCRVTCTPRRIAITADVLRPRADRPGTPITSVNGQWLQRLLAYPLSQVTDLPVSRVGWGEGFDAEAFYRAVGEPPTVEGWAAVHYAADLPPAAMAVIEAAFAGSVVVSCEITPCIAGALDRLGVPVIDTVGHPIRFLDDLLNAWRSNRPAVNERLQRFEFDLTQAHVQAGLVAAKMAWAPPIVLPENTGVLLGQVDGDKALIDRRSGRLLGFADFVESLFELAERYDRVLYRAHPYQAADPTAGAVIARFKSFHRTTSNFYRLLAHHGVQGVHAISSGGCAEAPYFGKAGHWFHGPLYDFGLTGADEHGLRRPIPIEHEWLWPAFWHAVLEPVAPVRDAPRAPGHYRSNRIRRSLNADWGFGAVDAVVSPALG